MNSVSRKIANVMLGRGKGGIEQAFLDYNDALDAAGVLPVPVISDGALVESRLAGSRWRRHTLRQLGWWDLAAARRLSRLLRNEDVTAIFTHGKRALSLVRLASRGTVPVIAVAHNYARARFDRADAVIAPTSHLADHLEREGVTTGRIFVVPHAVRVPRWSPPFNPFHTLPVIATMGRMVRKKGFDDFCAALSMLKRDAVRFKAIIAGDGEERAQLARRISALGLDADIELPGWIEGDAAKDAFWQGIDVFCLPSLHEPFGIVLLEAWAAGKPVVTTDSEGPGSIATHGLDAMFAPKGDPAALAGALRRMLEHPEEARALAQRGYDNVRTRYTVEALAKGLAAVVASVVTERAGGEVRAHRGQ